jgi:hypothetical protein
MAGSPAVCGAEENANDVFMAGQIEGLIPNLFSPCFNSDQYRGIGTQ